MALSKHEVCTNKSLFNEFMLHPFEIDPTFELHDLYLEGATLWTIKFKSVLLDSNAIYCMVPSTL